MKLSTAMRKAAALDDGWAQSVYWSPWGGACAVGAITSAMYPRARCDDLDRGLANRVEMSIDQALDRILPLGRALVTSSRAIEEFNDAAATEVEDVQMLLLFLAEALDSHDASSEAWVTAVINGRWERMMSVEDARLADDVRAALHSLMTAANEQPEEALS